MRAHVRSANSGSGSAHKPGVPGKDQRPGFGVGGPRGSRLFSPLPAVVEYPHFGSVRDCPEGNQQLCGPQRRAAGMPGCMERQRRLPVIQRSPDAGATVIRRLKDEVLLKLDIGAGPIDAVGLQRPPEVGVVRKAGERMRYASRYYHRVNQGLQELERRVGIVPGGFLLMAEEAVHAAQLYRPAPYDALPLDVGFPGTLHQPMRGSPERSISRCGWWGFPAGRKWEGPSGRGPSGAGGSPVKAPSGARASGGKRHQVRERRVCVLNVGGPNRGGWGLDL